MKKLNILLVLILLLTLVSCSQAEAELDNSKPTVTVSDEVYGKNVGNSIEQARILRKDEELKKYDVYLDDNGILNIMVFDDENADIEYGEEIKSELFAKHKKVQNAFSDAKLDSEKIIYRKVKFSKDYLLNIQDFVTKHAKDYDIIGVGSGGIYNQVEIELLDIEKSKDILALLEQNITDFSRDSVRFLESEPYEDY